MKDFSRLILALAERLIPQDKRGWVRAMRAEHDEIDTGREKLTFVLGSLKVAVLSRAKTPQGLNLIGRSLLTGALGSISFIVFWVTRQFESAQMANIFFCLCIFYTGAAMLALLSLRGLRIYAGAGLLGTSITWLFVQRTGFARGDLSNDFLLALSLEVTGIMAGVLIAALYLSLIYNPEDIIS